MRIGRPKSTSGPRYLYTSELRKRKERIENGENVEPLTQNGFWYHMRTIFLKNRINPHLQGKYFRKNQTNSIIEICKELDTTREDLKIFASSRAFFYYEDGRTPVSLSTIQNLIKKGTDIIIIEKEGICELLFDKIKKSGIALLDTKGFAVEYAKRLSGLSQSNIAMITDFDDSGLLMYEDVKKLIPSLYRIGIDLNTVKDLVYKYDKSTGITLENVKEDNISSNHWERLRTIYAFKINSIEGYGLDDDETKETLRKNLEYIKNKRIEIDGIEGVIGIDKFWQFIKNKLNERFPIRDYNRAIQVPEAEYPEIFLRFHELLLGKIKTVLEPDVKRIKGELKEFKGIMDDTDKRLQDIHDNFKVKVNKEDPDLIQFLCGMWMLYDELKE